MVTVVHQAQTRNLQGRGGVCKRNVQRTDLFRGYCRTLKYEFNSIHSKISANANPSLTHDELCFCLKIPLCFCTITLQNNYPGGLGFHIHFKKS